MRKWRIGRMERLTFEVHDGGLFVKETDVKTYEVEDEVMHTGNAIRKLAEYEDLEEQGRLLKLPVSIGDTVYEISSKLLPLRIKNFEISADGIYANIVSDVYGYKFLRMTLDIDNLGKTWFVTREQAEAALKELEGKK